MKHKLQAPVAKVIEKNNWPNAAIFYLYESN